VALEWFPEWLRQVRAALDAARAPVAAALAQSGNARN
jgi:hypothetical protein